MTITILNLWTAAILWTGEAENLRDGVEKAVSTGANLAGADLAGADLTGTNLTRADLTGADLTGADLAGADLTGADLTRADLTGADLTRANLAGANLTDANLTRANLTDANLTDANLTDADLTPIRDDLWAVLSSAPAEAHAVLAALRDGRVDGSTYSGECACLVGTIANARGCDVSTLARNSARPAERFFMGIKAGDTPDTNPVSKLAADWVDEWVTGMRAAFGATA